MKRRKLFRLLLFLLFLLLAVLHDLIFSSILSALTLIIYIFYLILYDQIFMLRYLYYVYSTCAVITSLLICELSNGYYLKEIDSYTKYVGSIPLLVLGLYVFLCALESRSISNHHRDLVCFLENEKDDSNSHSGKAFLTLKILNVISLLLLLYLFVCVIPKPAFLLNTDRTFYFSLYGPDNRLFNLLVGQVSVIVSIPLLLLIYNKETRVLPIIAIIVYVLFQLWIGNKFTPFVSVACIYFMLYTSGTSRIDKKRIKVILRIGILFLGFAIVAAVIIQSHLSNLNRIEYAMTRLSQQGQLWWKTFDITDRYHPNEFINEIINIFYGGKQIENYIGSNVGIYKIMYLCGPRSLVDHRLSTGTRYTEGGYACALLYFGPLGVVFYSIFNAFVITSIVKGIFRAVENNDYIRYIILIRLLLRYNTFISMFTLAELFDIGCIISYVYLILFNRKILIFKYSGIKRQRLHSLSKERLIVNEQI